MDPGTERSASSHNQVLSESWSGRRCHEGLYDHIMTKCDCCYSLLENWFGDSLMQKCFQIMNGGWVQPTKLTPTLAYISMMRLKGFPIQRSTHEWCWRKSCPLIQACYLAFKWHFGECHFRPPQPFHTCTSNISCKPRRTKIYYVWFLCNLRLESILNQ